MAKILRMPEVAANAAEAVIQGWPVAENAAFSAGDAVVTVETEKAVVDVEADADGVMLKTLAPEGVAVEVGQPIAVIGEPGETVGDLAGLLARLGVSEPSGPVVIAERRDVPGHAVPMSPTPQAESAPAVNRHGAGERIFASPLARRLAKEARIPVEQIRGTGPGGRIVRRDVQAAASDRAAATGAKPPAPAPEPAAMPAAPPGSAYTDLPHSRMRVAIAARLTASKQTTPHFYLHGACRVGKLLKLRKELNAGGPVRISINDLVIKAAARAHVLVPGLNVVWTPEAIRSFSSVDISVAIATERGLVTPVLRSVQQMSVSIVAAQVQDFVARAKSAGLRQEEIEGGTLTITNLGMFGTEDFSAIINPPQAAILAVGAVKQEPVVKNGKVRPGAIMRVTLSVDHRSVDGVLAAEWMSNFVSMIENPLQILL